MGDPNVTESQKAPEKRSFGKLVAQAALHLPNLGVAGVGAAVAVGLHSLPIAAIGGATYVAMVAWDMVSPEFWKKKQAGAQKATPAALTMPDKSELKSARLRSLLEDVVAAKRQLQRTLDETPESVSQHLTSVILLEAELETRAATLLRRADAIERSLGSLTSSPADVAAEINNLTRLENSAGDAGAREQYKQARLAKEEEARALSDLGGNVERAYANLTRIVAVLESLSVKVAHLRAVDAAVVDSVTGDIGKELDNVNVELRAFEDSLASAASITPSMR